MTSTGRFVELATGIAALAGQDSWGGDGSDTAGPELLPVRLSRACVRVLAVDGASLSLFTHTDLRVPIGASDDDATYAERLQFTLGQGPCFQAQSRGEMVFGREGVLSRSWPQYHQELLAHTPFRGVLSLPLDQGLQGMGALDLYFRDDERMSTVDVGDVRAVAATVTSLLTDMPHDRGEGEGPDWLRSSAVDSRAQVWVAMGMVNTEMRLSSADALAVLRAYSFARNRTVDDTAADLSHRRMSVGDLLAS